MTTAQEMLELAQRLVARSDKIDNRVGPIPGQDADAIAVELREAAAAIRPDWQLLHAAINEDWLKSAGFKWHQLDRQTDKHWLLWLGDATRERHSFTSFEDIGIELAPCWWKNSTGDDAGDVGKWFCWFRDDAAGRYHRFIHIRHLRTVGELVLLVEAITGQKWDPANNLYGSMRKPEDAERIRQESQRFDRRLIESGPPWSDIEKDDTRGRALPEHMTAAIKGGGAK
jgi:hypothetical protein